ncbi:hypothetical protein AC578_2594 [Pseudocercospora eumusae]|uniref:Uncharacterized protein n=1 Tax=Pseudocercospora eumusae TaxID=321146 RepID=A0A139GYM7_9PEZI|nr:hypothetical protein AC578_2594 [Pseudocercospora eumusae]
MVPGHDKAAVPDIAHGPQVPHNIHVNTEPIQQKVDLRDIREIIDHWIQPILAFRTCMEEHHSDRGTRPTRSLRT